MSFWTGGRWIQGCKKEHLLAVLYQIADMYRDQGVYFKLGEEITDEIIKERYFHRR